jgi:hypothetical protein
MNSVSSWDAIVEVQFVLRIFQQRQATYEVMTVVMKN